MARYTFAKGLIVTLVIGLGAFAGFSLLRLLIEEAVMRWFGVSSPITVYAIIFTFAMLILAIGFRFRIRKILERFFR